MASRYSKVLEYWIIALGCVLAFISAFKPQAAIGYQLDTSVLLAGLLPYFVYSIAVVLLQSFVATLHGIVLLVVHAWMISSVRITETSGYSSDLLVNGPLVLSVVLLPVAIVAWRKPYGQED